jgi:hypothetical protein
MTGLKIGPWILGSELGRGPVGTVYRAAHADDPAKVAAVKLLRPELCQATGFPEKFQAEMLALHRLNHPNIARYYESGIHAGSAYFACELVEGSPLTELLRAARKPEEPGLDWRSVGLSLAVQVSRALRHGHHRSLLHRDLKPGNVIVQPDGVLKLTDFGLGRLFLASPLSLPAEPLGTACYLAPEFFIGKPLTRRSDLYALGGLLYTLFCGRPPFAAGTAAEFMHKHCYVLPDRPIQFVPKLPHDLDELICTLLQKDPNRRPASAPAVIEELDRIRGKAERKGERVVWPAAEGEGTGTLAALAAEAEANAEYQRFRPRPLMSRPAVVIPLFLLFVAFSLALYFWPRPSADELYQSAQPFLSSENPDDWQHAWNEYLQPLSEKFPDAHSAELTSIRTKIDDRAKLKRAIDAGARAKAGSEAERLYLRGLALSQSGDRDQARQTWQALRTMFAGQPGEERWFKLAGHGLAELSLKPPVNDSERQRAKQATLDRIQGLRSQGKNAEADAMLAAYRQAYHGEDDAEAKPRE